MSTLKTINVIHPSGVTNNIVNDASGNVTVGGNLTVSGTGVMNIGSGQLYKDASGNVGIGTSSPGSKLEVTQGILTINTTDQSLTRLQLKNTGASGRTYEIVGGLPGTNNSQLSFYDATAAATRMTIDSSGNVGIGTSSPSGKLDVNVGGSAGRIVFQANSTANYITSLNSSASASNDLQINGNNLQFLSGGSEKARIDTSGNWYMNSGYGSSAVAYGCRAWLNYNLSTQTTRASGNVSSVTYNSTGYFTINFTNALPDANYALAGMGEWTSGTTSQTYPFIRNTTPPTTTNCPIVVSSNGFSNPTWLTIMIVR